MVSVCEQQAVMGVRVAKCSSEEEQQQQQRQRCVSSRAKGNEAEGREHAGRSLSEASTLMQHADVSCVLPLAAFSDCCSDCSYLLAFPSVCSLHCCCTSD